MRDSWERLRDMLEAIHRVEKYASHGRLAFDSDELIQVYILHYLQILGEAAYKVPSEFRQKHKEIPWKSIEGMRHILVHDYFQVDLKVVWEVVEKELPGLKKTIEGALNPGLQESPAVYKAHAKSKKVGKSRRRGKA